MPKMGGEDLAHRLSALRPGLRVLYMSGHTRHLLGEGTVLLEKPFAADKLLSAVRMKLDRRE